MSACISVACGLRCGPGRGSRRALSSLLRQVGEVRLRGRSPEQDVALGLEAAEVLHRAVEPAPLGLGLGRAHVPHLDHPVGPRGPLPVLLDVALGQPHLPGQVVELLACTRRSPPASATAPTAAARAARSGSDSSPVYLSRSSSATATFVSATAIVALVLLDRDLVVLLGLDLGGVGLVDVDLLVADLSWRSESSRTMRSWPCLTRVPSSITQLMVVANPLFPARTLQTTSLVVGRLERALLGDRDVEVSFLTLWSEHVRPGGGRPEQEVRRRRRRRAVSSTRRQADVQSSRPPLAAGLRGDRPRHAGPLARGRQGRRAGGRGAVRRRVPFACGSGRSVVVVGEGEYSSSHTPRSSSCSSSRSR